MHSISPQGGQQWPAAVAGLNGATRYREGQNSRTSETFYALCPEVPVLKLRWTKR